MAAYLIANIDVHDPATFERYRKEASATVEKYGGRYIVRGGTHEVIEGDWQPARLVVVEFPNMTTLKRWYESDDYQKIVGLRTTSSTGRLVAVEGL